MRAPFKLKGHALPGPFKQKPYIDPTPTIIGIEVPPVKSVNPSHVQMDLTESIAEWQKKYGGAVKKTSKLSKIAKFLGGKLFGAASFMLGAHSASAQGLTEKKDVIDYSKIDWGNLPVGGESSSTSIIKSAD